MKTLWDILLTYVISFHTVAYEELLDDHKSEGDLFSFPLSGMQMKPNRCIIHIYDMLNLTEFTINLALFNCGI